MNRPFFSASLLAFAGLSLAVVAKDPASSSDQAPEPVTFQSQAKPLPAGEKAGARPYEMVRANRVPPIKPLVSFDSLDGWKIEGRRGGVGELALSQKQRVWESPVARLTYKGNSKESRITILPPKPIPIPEPFSAATLWVYGNNWGWAPDPKTPPVDLHLLMRTGSGETRKVKLDTVRWKEWWLIHRIIPADLAALKPLNFAGFEIDNCANTEERELFFEDLVFFQESPRPIKFDVRPRRGIDPFPGQDAGANTGAGRLPFPTREQTILPENASRDFETAAAPSGTGYVLSYKGHDCVLEYAISPVQPFFRDIKVRLNGNEVATAWSGAGPEFGEEPAAIRQVDFAAKDGVIRGSWRVALKGAEALVTMEARLWQKSLVIDAFCPGGISRGLSYGTIKGVRLPGLLLLPYINYGSHHLNVLLSKGSTPFFAGVWMDWYRSNASEPYAVDKIEGSDVRLNGGVRYLAKTDGKRNPMYERTFMTFSPVFEETLPTIANPPAARGKEAGARLWQETWGPENYEKEHQRSARLRAYGIEMLTQCNHEITWRDGGESFTFRTMAAPGRGGDEALRSYVAGQKALGWRSGLYTNYCDFAPVNSFWDPDMVMRDSGGNLVRAWPRCYSPKSLFAVEMDRKLAPAIVAKFGSNAAYTDVHTSVSPWERCDYDARVPGAGTFAATFYAYGELLLHDQGVYDGFCWSEGNHQWMYAGLTTGNYGLTYSDLKLWQYPLLPHFDLLKMHPLSIDIGMPWTDQFFHGNKTWSRKENIEKSIDQFIATTIAYGHMGWLVEEKHGIRQTCRSYYMLQELQSRYAMQAPVSIRYGSGDRMLSSSEAFLSDGWKEGRLEVQYANGLTVWVNGNPDKPWVVTCQGVSYTLPAFGWLSAQEGFLTGSFVQDGKRFDRVSSSSYLFLDGRGTFREFDGIGSSGSVAARASAGGHGLSVIAIDGVDRITLSPGDGPFGEDDIRGIVTRVAGAPRLNVRSFDASGKLLREDQMTGTAPSGKPGWEIRAVSGALRYEIQPVFR